MRSDTDRRTFLLSAGAAAATVAIAGCSGGGDGDGGDDGGDDGGNGGSVPGEVDDWMSDANNYDGSAADMTGESEVTIDVGPGGEFQFDPAAVRIDSGTTVLWQWQSGGHSVQSESTPGDSFNSEIQDEGAEFEQTFDSAGNVLYFCLPHQANGHLGALIVEG